ncbi:MULTISPECIES: CDP-diacylglycerol--glycerol-3-phosphate 3-phosphatidyltransferase [unclassified Fusibacter]|uniref:CDP-diacylglycerol--glycerol-3-phosphate 3-phosphatidyltransferase n=1 Tax=unclassified Fusibacter TaxID=2624464 RepID=UPI001011A9BF|nr:MULTISPECIES: CDP-diacylglycerol--glycerol-3-phosphate 3-phosphatidyltransferase [unclassified Fusibacter]MCK8058858.1 CDP-diacylglycerol--glycerol-3-phosphate 3-phosphatidyltransferase [Fusibacter sp. A2]NPE21932.1 CDP-diacylglycerol--glycerol-3-phosphate 3-phosphatidyltransferase [Fusibacter sp. A1]RXV61502.1 CDP-diacylglycerol--glycerol-3-phosphate 3-phosphatidyltransferase [Fusibacter sp. A1]
MNLATQLTVLRLALVPVFMVLLALDTPLLRWVAFAVFVIASITDFLDGYIARKMNQVTKLGKLLDPLADKVLVTAALVGLVELGEIAGWIVVVILSREFIISIFRAMAASTGLVIAASYWAKIKTTVQMIAILLLLANNYPASMIGIPLDQIMLYIATILTVVSGVEYLLKNKQVLKE